MTESNKITGYSKPESSILLEQVLSANDCCYISTQCGKRNQENIAT